MPEVQRTFLLGFDNLDGALAARDRILTGALQPAALDLLNPAAAGEYGDGRWVLAMQASGNEAAIKRYEFEVSSLSDWAAVDGAAQETFWTHVRDFTPRHLATNRDGAVVRVSCTLKELGRVLGSFETPAIARAANGVSYACFAHFQFAEAWVAQAVGRGWRPVIEFAPEAQKNKLELWPSPGGDLELMKRIKQMFDPDRLLNRGRLYRHI
jgi:glycolate oxidase FAD binding subunit